MEERIKFHVGLDVHKDSISVAVVEPGRAPGRFAGKVAHDVSKLLKMLAGIGATEQLHIQCVPPTTILSMRMVGWPTPTNTS